MKTTPHNCPVDEASLTAATSTVPGGHSTLQSPHLQKPDSSTCTKTASTQSLLLTFLSFELKPQVNEPDRASQVALVAKNPPANAEDTGDASSIPGLGRSPTKGHGNPLWYSCLENPTDRGAWQATVKQLSMHTCRWAWLIYMRSCVCVRQQASRGNNFSMFSFRKEDGTCKPGNSLNVAKWLRRLEASIES